MWQPFLVKKCPVVKYGIINYLVGIFFILVGWLFAIWSIVAQLNYGQGTPLPIMATQTLLTSGPFAYCRNPMSLGTIILYSGIAIWIGSFSAIGIVFIFTVLIVLYLKYIEEKELEKRFGEPYIEYKNITPFLLPSLRKRN